MNAHRLRHTAATEMLRGRVEPGRSRPGPPAPQRTHHERSTPRSTASRCRPWPSRGREVRHDRPGQRSLADYLALRRELGYKATDRAGRLLAQFVDFCEELDTEVVTVELALTWAMDARGMQPGLGGISTAALARLRPLPARPRPSDRRAPDEPAAREAMAGPRLLYSSDQVVAMMVAAGEIRSALRAATMEAVVGLRLHRPADRGGARARSGRRRPSLRAFSPSTTRSSTRPREVPLHPTAAAASRRLRQQARDALSATGAAEPAFFVSAERGRGCNP